MKISHKLVGSFIGVSLLTGVVGAVAIAQNLKIAESLAITLDSIILNLGHKTVHRR